MDESIADQYKEKTCPYCGGILKPEHRGTMAIKWKCNQCPHKEYLGPLNMQQMGQAMLNYKQQ